jgi:hypothetical protein
MVLKHDADLAPDWRQFVDHPVAVAPRPELLLAWADAAKCG